MNSVHENGLLTRDRAARPPKRISTAILVTIAVGLVLCSALPSWFLMRSAKFTADIRSGDFGYYNNERVMLTENSARNRIMDIPDVRSDFKFTRPAGRSVTLQVPQGIRDAKATWAA